MKAIRHVSFIDSLFGKPAFRNPEFDAEINLNLNGKQKVFHCKVSIAVHELHFTVRLTRPNLDGFPDLFDSRHNIFTNEYPGSITVAGITREYSYKATIFPLSDSSSQQSKYVMAVV